VLVVERIWGGAIHIIWIMHHTSSEISEEHELRDAVGVGVSKTCHSFGKHSVQIFVFYIPVGPINAVLGLAKIGHLVGALEPECFTGRSASCKQFFDDSVLLSIAHELKINYSFPVCTSHFRLGVTGFSTVPTFYKQLRQH